MKKKTVAAVMIMLMVFSLTACGDKKKDEGKAEVAPREEFNTEAQGEFQSISDADFATQNDVDYELYEDTNGWGLYYDKKRIKVDKVDKGAKFTYTGKAAGEDSVTITYEKNKMPREVLAEKFASNPELLKNMEEGYLLEYMTRYCYRVKSTTATASDADADNPYSDAFLGFEYNHGTMLIKMVMSEQDDAEVINDISKAIQDVVETLYITNVLPESEFENYPGDYYSRTGETLEGEFVPDKIVTLNVGHTGSIFLDKNSSITWTSTYIEDYDGNKYEYKIEGDQLLLKVDNDWLTFERRKEEATEESEEETEEKTEEKTTEKKTEEKSTEE